MAGENAIAGLVARSEHESSGYSVWDNWGDADEHADQMYDGGSNP